MVKSKANAHNWTIITVVIAGVVIGSAFFIVKVLNVNPLSSSASVNTTSQLTIISPNGGETLYAGSEGNVIKWFQAYDQPVEIRFDLKIGMYGGTVYNIANTITSYPGENSYTWAIPSGIGGGYNGNNFYLYLWCPNLGRSGADYSDGPFTMINDGLPTIAPNISVVYPNGGEKISQGQKINIVWDQDIDTSEPVYAKVLFRGDPLDGNQYYSVVAENALSVGGRNEITWPIPTNLDTSKRYKVSVKLSRGWPIQHVFEDYSDTGFYLVPSEWVSPR